MKTLEEKIAETKAVLAQNHLHVATQEYVFGREQMERIVESIMRYAAEETSRVIRQTNEDLIDPLK